MSCKREYENAGRFVAPAKQDETNKHPTVPRACVTDTRWFEKGPEIIDHALAIVDPPFTALVQVHSVGWLQESHTTSRKAMSVDHQAVDSLQEALRAPSSAVEVSTARASAHTSTAGRVHGAGWPRCPPPRLLLRSMRRPAQRPAAPPPT
jgi:hypothetical protein